MNISIELVLLLIRLFLAAVFLLAGIGKFLDKEGSRTSIRDFGAPEKLVQPLVYIVPFIEIFAAICLLFVETSWLGTVLVLLLLIVFTGGMLRQIYLGQAPDCHCFGQVHSEPVGKKSIVRNMLFLLLTAFLVIQGPHKQGTHLADTASGMIQSVLLLLVVILGVILISFLQKLLSQQTEIIRRLGVADISGEILAPVERNDAGDPHDSIPIGAPVPDFSMQDLNGRIITFESLLGNPRPILMFFVGPTCDPCEALLPEIEEWETAISDKVRIIFVSYGDKESNEKKFGSPERMVLVEKAREFALSVHAKWTPTALFIDTDGNVGSHIAAGDIAIRRLVEQIKQKHPINEEFTYFLGLNGYGRPKIGKSVPSFSVNDMDGNIVNKDIFSGKKTMVVMASQECSHCSKLLQQIAGRERQKGIEDIQFLIFSDNDPEELKKFNIVSSIIYDKKFEIAKQFGLFGMPSAVMVDQRGIIVTEAAIGPPNIWSLIGERDAAT